MNIGSGVRLRAGLGLGVAVSQSAQGSPVPVDARIPHPFFFDRQLNLGGVADVTRHERAVHLETRWFAQVDSIEI